MAHELPYFVLHLTSFAMRVRLKEALLQRQNNHVLRASITLLVIFLLNPFRILSAQSFTLSGTIRDAQNGELLIGVSISVEGQGLGTVSNSYGYYALNLPAGNYQIRYSFIGYEDIVRKVALTNHQQINVNLEETSTLMQEVVVTESAIDDQVRNTEMGVNKLQAKEIKKIPQLMGEVDVIRTLTLLPGVSTVGEGASGFNVRGGNVDQNLILGDEAPVYNSSHLLGFFSIFNADAVKEMKLYKGGVPAQYGGRLSSVLDIRQKEGNAKHFAGTGGLGLLSSRLLLEGPIVKDKLSWMIAGRRSYADLFLRLSNNEELNQNILYFYDLNGKMNYRINEKNTLFISGYYGRDVFGIRDAFNFDWGNGTVTLRWNSILSEALFANFTLVYSDYVYNLGTPDNQEFTFNWESRIQNYLTTAAFNWYQSPDLTIDFGITNTWYTFDPAVITGSIQNRLDRLYATEPAAYLQFRQKFNNRLSIDYGLRYSGFVQMGPGDIYNYAAGSSLEDTTVIGQTSYSQGESIASFFDANGLEPRFAMTYLLSEEQSIKLGYNRMRQYIHLISNTTATTPIDIWRPSGPYIEPATADQISIGYFLNLDLWGSKYDFSVETYYKSMRNIVDYKDGADLIFNDKIETELISGEGRAYGLEVLMRKNSGALTGWISYTWSRTERLVDGPYPGEQINNGEWYPANYDKTHDISVVATYTLSKKWDLGLVWVFQTGRPITYPSARAEYETGITYPVYNNRNGARTPHYHRLDLSANYTPKKKEGRKWESSWAFGLYNAYGRRNPYSVFFRQNEFNPQITEAVQLSIFGNLIPSVTYNFTF